jgi:hypothetical protein
MDFNNVFKIMEVYQSLGFEVSESRILPKFIVSSLKNDNVLIKEIENNLINTFIIDEAFLKDEKNLLDAISKKTLTNKNEIQNEQIINELVSYLTFSISEESLSIKFLSPLNRVNSLNFYENIKNAYSKFLIQQITTHAKYTADKLQQKRDTFISIKEKILEKEINDTYEQIKLVNSLDPDLLEIYVKLNSNNLWWNIDYLEKKIEKLLITSAEKMLNDYEAEEYSIYFSDQNSINDMIYKLESLKKHKFLFDLFFYENSSFKYEQKYYHFLYLFALIFVSLTISLTASFLYLKN